MRLTPKNSIRISRKVLVLSKVSPSQMDQKTSMSHSSELSRLLNSKNLHSRLTKKLLSGKFLLVNAVNLLFQKNMRSTLKNSIRILRKVLAPIKGTLSQMDQKTSMSHSSELSRQLCSRKLLPKLKIISK